jgi:hypothetical protein
MRNFYARRLIHRAMTFAKWVYRLAGIYGVLVVPPLYFLERRIGVQTPPPITHPEYFYGFVGVALAWQIAFLIISTDPARYRPLMPAAMIEKFSFAIAGLVLFAGGRVAGGTLAFACLDLLLGLLFIAAWAGSRPVPAAEPA